MGIESLTALIRTHGTERPDLPAIEFEGRTITYGELHDRSSRIAAVMAADGVAPGDRVAFLDKNGPEFFEVTFGVAKRRAVGVAVNWRLAPNEMAWIINDARAKVLVVGPDFVPHVEKIEDELTSVSHILAIGGHARWDDYESLVAAHEPLDDLDEPRPDEIALQLYTSGTTGLPKGVMLSNSNLFGMLDGVTTAWSFDPASVSIACMPMFHIAGSGWATVGLFHGARTVLLRDVDPARILTVVPEFGVTNALFVPAVIQFLLLTPGVDDTDFSTLRSIVYGASPITDTVLTKAMAVFGCDFIQVYGLTETTGAITQLDAADHDPVGRPRLLRSCGRPYPWVEMRIVDPDSGEDVADGEVGSCGHGPARTWSATGPTRTPPPRPSPTTAGSRPATPATATRRASCTSTTG